MYLTFCFRMGWAGVASLMVRFLGVSCYSGQWIFGLSLFLGIVLGFFRSGVILGLWGCGLAFGFRFRGCFGLRVMGKLGLLVGGCGFWCLGALVISDYKWVVCFCWAMTGVSVLGSWGRGSLGDSVLFIPREF